MGTDFVGGTLESKSLTLTMWYKHRLDIILQNFRQEMIQPLGIEFSPFHSKMGLFGNFNWTIVVINK